MENIESTFPIRKKDEILRILEAYHPIVHTNDEPEYSYLTDYGVSIGVERNGEELLYVELDDEFTLGLSGWHCHYYDDEIGYKEFLRDLNRVLNNELGGAQVLCNNNWMGSFPVEKKNLSREKLIKKCKQLLWESSHMSLLKEYGYVIQCRFFDPKDDVVNEVSPRYRNERKHNQGEVVYCPLLETEIEDAECFDACMTLYGAPEWTAPPAIQVIDGYKKFCRNCPNNKEEN